MTAERQLNPTGFSNEELDRFVFAIMGRMKEMFPHGYEKPLTKAQLAEHLEYTIPQVDKLMKAGIILPRRLGDGMDPRFFLSDIKWK